MTDPKRLTMQDLKAQSETLSLMRTRIAELEAEVERLEDMMLAWQESARAFSRGSMMAGDQMMQNAIAMANRVREAENE